LALFVGITCAGSWALVGTFAALGGQWGSPESRFVGVLHMLPPAVAALVVQGAISRRPLLDPLGIRFPRSIWFLLAWLAPLVLLGVGLAVAALLGHDLVTSTEELVTSVRDRIPAGQMEQFEKRVSEQPPPHPAMLVVYALLAGITIDLVLSLGEELGWRGYLLHDLPGGYWQKSWTIGLIWGVWFVPSVLLGQFYPEHRTAGAGLIIAWTLLLSPAVVYVRLRARTVFAAAVFRGSLMALFPVGQDLIRGQFDLIEPPYGLTGFVGAGVLLGLLWLHDRFVADEPIMGGKREASR
jgi:membrane protease YdiL (CAAX protease family)